MGNLRFCDFLLEACIYFIKSDQCLDMIVLHYESHIIMTSVGVMT